MADSIFNPHDHPSTYKDSEPAPPRFPETHKLKYAQLQAHALELWAQIHGLEAKAKAAQADLFSRRLEAIRTGQPLPDGEPLWGLPAWAVQQGKERIAASNRALDEETARKVPGYKLPGS